MKKKRIARKPFKHLWKVEVRHRDYIPTVNDRTGRVWMTFTNLNIVVASREEKCPEIEKAVSRIRAFLKRNQRRYGLPSIREVAYHGTIDEIGGSDTP